MAKKRTDNTMGKLLTGKRDTWACVVYPRLAGIDDDTHNRSLLAAGWYAEHGDNDETYTDEEYSVLNAREDVRAAEDAAYDKFIGRIKAAGGDNVAWILHNMDVHTVDGKKQYKKSHIHIIKRFDKAVSCKYACEWLVRSVGDAITDTIYTAFRPVEDVKAAEKYLYHDGVPRGTYNNDGKYGYSPDEVGLIGRLVPVGYADFMRLVLECGNFLELSDKCMQSEEMAKMLVKHCYYARTFYSAARDGCVKYG